MEKQENVRNLKGRISAVYHFSLTFTYRIPNIALAMFIMSQKILSRSLNSKTDASTAGILLSLPLGKFFGSVINLLDHASHLERRKAEGANEESKKLLSDPLHFNTSMLRRQKVYVSHYLFNYLQSLADIEFN
eukprot:scaffold6355_cov119-Cylindrotheca_fusiformis.AAC.14